MATENVYEERYRFPAGFGQMLFICTAFVLGGVFAHLPTLLRIVELVVFGAGVVVLLVIGVRMTRRRALRVDESGLAFAGAAITDASTELIRWPEVRAVRVSLQADAPRLPVITVVRRDGQQPIIKQVKGWRLDGARFAASLQRFAPQVRLTDDR